MNNEAKTTNAEMTSYRAVGLAEGFETGSAKEVIEAWAYLIRTGMCWSLQGWFGRTAQDFIDKGFISETGEIFWPVIEDATGNIF